MQRCLPAADQLPDALDITSLAQPEDRRIVGDDIPGV